MGPRAGGSRGWKARGWRAADQARPALLLVALCVGGCDRVGELDPRPFFANAFGAAHLEGREPPPGLDQPYPRLSSVPPRPPPPDAAARDRIMAALAADREKSRSPLGIVPPAQAPAAGEGVGAPPAPPRLAAVPPVRLDPLPGEPAPAAAPVVPRPGAPPATPAAPAPEPAAAPAPPPAPPPGPPRELLAPPPAPSRDLLAPPPPPGADLLAPRRN